MGNVFSSTSDSRQPKESLKLTATMAGRWTEPAWFDQRVQDDLPGAELRAPQLNFFDGKGVVESLMDDLGPKKWKIRSEEYPWLQPGRSAQIVVSGQIAGWIGEVHPSVLAEFEATGPVVAFELDVDVIVCAATKVKPYSEIPRFPAVERDVALVVDEEVSFERVHQSILSAGGKLLDSARLFDVYRGPGVPDGKKSLAFSLSYRNSDRTLTEDEVQPVHEKLLRKVAGAVGAELRG
jgi:phenylalanyl-tRNA synthetase beta chain